MKFSWQNLFITLALMTLMEAPRPAAALEKPTQLTLDRAIEEGLKRSPEIQGIQASVQEKHWARFEALGSGFLPKVSLSGTQYLGVQYAITQVNLGGSTLGFPGFYPNTQLSIELMVPIFDGFANIHRLAAATLLQDAAEQDLTYSQFQLTQEIRLAFYRALAASELQAVAEQNVKTLEDHLKQVKTQLQGGAATSYDTLRVEVQLSEAKADAIDTEDNVTLTQKKLAELLGLEKDDRLLEGSLPTPDSNLVKNLELNTGVQERADIRALDLRAEAASRREGAQNVWMVPTLSIGGQYLLYNQQLFNNTVTNTGNYLSAYNVGLFLKWNLFDGGMAIAQANEREYQRIQADKSSEAAKLRVPYDFAYWKRRYMSNADHYLAKKFDITRSEESVRLAKEEERAGTRTSSETLDAELDLFRAKAGAVNAQVNAAEAQVRLELALGRKL